ncbi:hypothetical protein [Rhizobium leguminosarum]|uniref:hypothetical protein n=1 Tax=Rhizobium leguminosarum TaxID=384 RepID=UPI001C96ED9C|nr:hypothetical protein [Rhizobium leguminosarum]MBY5416397.1 hypothetical protein [Rhizobium leguminosarum]
MDKETFEGVAETLEQALAAAHMQIPVITGNDFTLSRVIDWGMQYGGFNPQTLFYVRVVADRDSAFKTKT